MSQQQELRSFRFPQAASRTAQDIYTLQGLLKVDNTWKAAEWSHSLPSRHGSKGLVTLDFLEGKRSHLKESKKENNQTATL